MIILIHKIEKEKFGSVMCFVADICRYQIQFILEKVQKRSLVQSHVLWHKFVDQIQFILEKVQSSKVSGLTDCM